MTEAVHPRFKIGDHVVIPDGRMVGLVIGVYLGPSEDGEMVWIRTRAGGYVSAAAEACRIAGNGELAR